MPPWWPAGFDFPARYASTTNWTNDLGQPCSYRLTCFGTIWDLAAFGGQYFGWSMGGGTGNTCSPFLLLNGNPRPGWFFASKFIVSG